MYPFYCTYLVIFFSSIPLKDHVFLLSTRPQQSSLTAGGHSFTEHLLTVDRPGECQIRHKMLPEVETIINYTVQMRFGNIQGHSGGARIPTAQLFYLQGICYGKDIHKALDLKEDHSELSS